MKASRNIEKKLILGVYTGVLCLGVYPSVRGDEYGCFWFALTYFNCLCVDVLGFNCLCVDVLGPVRAA